MPTLHELLRVGLPHDAEVLAGAAYLDREVLWIARLRAPAPALPPLTGGELILVSIGTLLALDSRPTLEVRPTSRPSHKSPSAELLVTDWPRGAATEIHGFLEVFGRAPAPRDRTAG